MSIPIASGGGLGVIPSPDTSGTGSAGSSIAQGTETKSTIQTVQPAGESGFSSASGQSGNNETTAGTGARTGARVGAISADVSIGPSPAFLTSVLEAATSRAALRVPAEKPPDGNEGATGAPPPETAAPLRADPTPGAQTQPLDAESRESFNLARGFADPDQRPAVNATI